MARHKMDASGYAKNTRTGHGKAITPAARDGAPCPICNKDDPPEMPPRFVEDDGTRH
jgi:hypothetical protein